MNPCRGTLIAGLACLSISGFGLACGGSGGGGFNVGGPTSCGQVSPCGGDVVGTWTFTTGCITAVGLRDAQAGSATCAGESIGVTGISVSGAGTFNADMTYAFSSLSKQGTFRLTVPQSCLSGATCAQVGPALQSTGAFESATCSGTSTCNCTAVQTPVGGSETGTYTISGSTLVTTSDTGDTSSIAFCVQGSNLHLIDTSTMSMGAMGMAAIDEDTVGTKQ